MGIRFTCDHCSETLNIKSVHAGKYAHCPHCRGKITVPLKSSAAELHPESEIHTDSGSGKAEPKAAGETDVVVDPIQEAPTKPWAVQNSQGDELGPFQSAEFLEQIEQKLIQSNWLVSREDWQDWQVAGKVFPELGPVTQKIPIAADSVFTDPDYRLPATISDSSRQQHEEKRKFMFGVTALSVGALIVMGLCYLLMRLL